VPSNTVPPTGGSQLPFTGGSTGPATLAAFVLLTGGGALAGVARRRRKA
jgi:LPXTG-motif cell wall-anchored protein